MVCKRNYENTMDRKENHQSHECSKRQENYLISTRLAIFFKDLHKKYIDHFLVFAKEKSIHKCHAEKPLIG